MATRLEADRKELSSTGVTVGVLRGDAGRDREGGRVHDGEAEYDPLFSKGDVLVALRLMIEAADGIDRASSTMAESSSGLNSRRPVVDDYASQSLSVSPFVHHIRLV